MQKKQSIDPAPAEDPARTRDRLLEAALEIFGKQGFTAATTRLLAEKARVNLAAIPYHFGGKEGLYRAVVEHIAGRVGQALDPLLEEIRFALASDQLPAPAALLLLERLLGALIDFVVGSPEAVRFSRIILREQMSPSAAYAIVFDRIMQPLLEALAALVARARGMKEVDRRLRLQAFALLGQVLVFRFGRETAVRGIGLSGYSAGETDEIREVILAQTRAMLPAPAIRPGVEEEEAG
jgi:TetR/AcrR family transcriptional regulator, regulator of cefoperazone and chloramphenicol sensitivity